MKLYFSKISASGVKTTKVPFGSFVSISSVSEIFIPLENSADFFFPSRYEVTLKEEDRAFTALTPTPFSPTDY